VNVYVAEVIPHWQPGHVLGVHASLAGACDACERKAGRPLTWDYLAGYAEADVNSLTYSVTRYEVHP
jgi:hypothetical protein